MNYFYIPNIQSSEPSLLDEEFNHCIKVLRHKPGDMIGLMDGKGGFAHASISSVKGKNAFLHIQEAWTKPSKSFRSHIGLSPTKNIDRMEWFVEKACELGVDEISFVQTQNSERARIRIDRLEKKALSALKQSKSGYLTKINELQSFQEVVLNAGESSKLIAVVEKGLPYIGTTVKAGQDTLVLIGPEGDFSPKEVEVALGIGANKISLGTNVLRTETAGIMAATTVNVVNQY